MSGLKGIMRHMNQPDSILGFITGPSLSFHFMDSVLNLFHEDPQVRFGYSRLVVFGPYIHANRSHLQREFMRTDRDWLLMLDNDMVFFPSDVWPLFHEADKRGPGIYSGPYVLENGFMVCGTWDDVEEVAYHNLVALPEKPTEIGMVGTGFTLIHREVFEALGPNAFSALKGPDGGDAGEDVSFCWRACEAGYVPILVPECNPGHFKNITAYPHQMVRNIIGEDINLVKMNDDLRTVKLEPLQSVGGGE